MSFLDGVSQCWSLSNQCVIDWDAWSSIGTMLGVLTALAGPPLRRHFASRRVSSIFASAFVNPLFTTVCALTDFKAKYRLTKPGKDEDERRHSLLSDAELEAAAGRLTRDIAAFANLDVDLSKFPDVNTVLAADVSRAVFFAREVSYLANMLERDRSNTPLDEWLKYCDVFGSNLDSAIDVAEHASTACERAMRRMSILKKLR